MIERLIKNVLDVSEVEGLCIFDKDGGLLLNRLPEYFIIDLFESLSQRIVSLFDVVDDNYLPCDDYLLKYPQKWVIIRRVNGLFLLLLTEKNVNQITLRMVSNLLMKHAKVDALKAIDATDSLAVEEPQSIFPNVPPNGTQPNGGTKAPMVPTATQTPVPEVTERAVTRTPFGDKKVAVRKKNRTYRGNSY